MHSIWNSNDPGEKFLWNLRVQRARELIENQETLAALRYDMKLFQQFEKGFGEVYAQMGIDFFGEVYKASERHLHEKRQPTNVPPPHPLNKVRPLTMTLHLDELPRDVVKIIELDSRWFHMVRN